jgi:hypothetical protein
MVVRGRHRVVRQEAGVPGFCADRHARAVALMGVCTDMVLIRFTSSVRAWNVAVPRCANAGRRFVGSGVPDPGPRRVRPGS